MGIIQKQSIRGTVYTYSGAVLGFIISGLLNPRLLTTAEIGLISILVSYAGIAAQLSSLGFNSVTTRLFPYFRNEQKRHNGFHLIGALITILGFALLVVSYFLFKDLLFDPLEYEGSLLLRYNYLLLPLTLFMLVFNFYDNYNKLLYNASRGLLLKEFVLRVFVIVAILFYAFDWVNLNGFINFYVISYALPLLILFAYLLKEKQISFKGPQGFIGESLRKTMLSVGFFGILSGASGIIAISIDRIMVERITGLDNAGIYTTCFYFGTLIVLPSRAILKIASTYIADAFKANDLDTIRSIYEKTSLNQFVVGSLLFIGLIANLDNVMLILTDDFEPGRYVVVLIGLTYLVEMLAGSSANIIANSKYYRMHAGFIFILVFLVVITNWIFIPKYGITGAAIATLLSKSIFHFLKVMFVWLRLKMQPFSLKFLIIMFVAAVSYFTGYVIPNLDFFVLDIIIRSAAIGIVFIVLIYVSKVSIDINALIDKNINKLNLKK